MDCYHISGRRKLEGEYSLKGAKNAVLPILAAVIASGSECVIKNCPDLSDVRTMAEILKEMGCRVTREKGIITVDSSTLDTFVIPPDLMKEIRSSVFLMGPTLARCGQVKLTHPGGCAIGSRPIDIHLSALKRLGVVIEENDGVLECKASRLIGTVIPLEFQSVGATENIMMAALAAEGETLIKNPAKEPEIVDLQNFLNGCGACISGAGTDEIRVNGKGSLGGGSHYVIPDRIEGGTILAAVAACGGDVALRNAIPAHMDATLSLYRNAGCRIKTEGDTVFMKAGGRLRSVDPVVTMPYPGFPTDMQSQIMAVMASAEGCTKITETIFENRFRHVNELEKMGARIRLEGRTAHVYGVYRLKGARVTAKDLRGGASLVVAALSAEGESVIENICHIQRGYDRFEEALKSLGASIRMVRG